MPVSGVIFAGCSWCEGLVRLLEALLLLVLFAAGCGGGCEAVESVMPSISAADAWSRHGS